MSTLVSSYYTGCSEFADRVNHRQSRNGPSSNVRTVGGIERRGTFASFPSTNAALQVNSNHNRRPATTSGPLLHQMHQAENQFRTVHQGLGHSLSVKTPPQGDHKKLDRSLSEPAERAQQVNQNSSRYKTELCRPFEENGTCKYGDKCQFAHGMQELRNLQRHPKYKTELCRTYHTTGLCPYGPRCHFIHNSEETKKSVISTLQSANLQSNPHPGVTRLRSVADGFGTVIGSKLLTRSVSSSHSGHRPKTMSVGSGFSLGSSSGDVSPPSSPSGSPTSLGSFFSEDPFTNFSNNNHATNLGASAFSFNPDFGVLLPPASSSHLRLQKENQSMMTGSTESRERSKEAGSSSESDSSKSSSSSGIGCGSPPPIHSSSYPGAPSSPVSSLGSDLEMMSLGGGSSPDPCGSPLDSSPTSSSKQATLPRLPTFARFSNNDGLTDLRL